MVQNNHLTECRFLQTVRSQHIIDADELKAQFCEFDLLLQEFLFSDAGYLGIDRTFNDLLFDLRYFGRKKGDGSSLFHKEIARKTDDLSPSEREKTLVSGSIHSADTSGSITFTLEPQGCMSL